MITALTPNLTLDRLLTLDRPLVAGHLHRVPGVAVAAGGKGVNLARAVRAFGGEVRVAGVVGGFNGQKFRRLLDEEGLESVLEEGEGETRECHILLDGSGAHPTELYEAGPAFQPQAVARLMARLPQDQVVVCGSLAPGTPPHTFAALLRGLKRPVVDSSGPGLEAAVAARAALIKPNEHELTQLTGSGGLEAARDLYRRTGVAVLLTRGASGAAYVGEETWEALAPVVQVSNPVGSGDSALGAFLYARQAREPLEQALRLAVAAGSANALLGGPSFFRAGVARDLLPQVRLTAFA